MELIQELCCCVRRVPFEVNVDMATLGVTAIIQPGGSVGNDESIAACDEYGIAVVFTGKRHPGTIC